MIRTGHEVGIIQTWLKDHTFVFMWVPLVVLSEALIPLIILPAAGIGVLLSWDRKYRTVYKTIINLGVESSRVLMSFNGNSVSHEESICPYCKIMGKEGVDDSRLEDFYKINKACINGEFL
jgi:hypothetical protein